MLHDANEPFHFRSRRIMNVYNRLSYLNPEKYFVVQPASFRYRLPTAIYQPYCLNVTKINILAAHRHYTSLLSAICLLHKRTVMNAMSKLHYLFTKHLRTMYAGEKSMVNALNAMSVTSEVPQMQEFYKVKAGENMLVLALLNKAFRMMGANADGETDSIIDSFLHNPEWRDVEYDSIYKSMMLSGRAIGVYRTNAMMTAISSAEDLAMFDVAEVLMECLPLVKFNRYEFEFLKTEFEKSGMVAREVEAA